MSRDIDGWRTHVADLEKQSGPLTLRVDTEHCETWITCEHLRLLEVKLIDHWQLDRWVKPSIILLIYHPISVIDLAHVLLSAMSMVIPSRLIYNTSDEPSSKRMST